MAIEYQISTSFLILVKVKVEELITYNQLLDHLEQAEEQDNSMDQELYKFRAIASHRGPLKVTVLNGKGSNGMFRLNGKLVKLHLNH